MTALATVLGFAYDSPVTEFPVRTGPGTNFDKAPFMALKGWRDLTVLDVQPDAQNTPNDSDSSRVYQWFHLAFPNGQSGWLRAHVVGIYGDWTDWGYGVVASATHAYTLVRDESRTGPQAAASVEVSVEGAAAEVHVTVNVQQVEAESDTVTTADVDVDVDIKPEAESSAARSALDAFALAARTASTDAAQVEVAVADSATSAGGLVDVEPTPAPPGDPVIIIKAQAAAPTRSGPAITFARTGLFIERHTRLPLLEVQQELAGQHYRWFKVQYQGRDCWLREDLATYEGNTDPLGLPSDLYPAPLRENYWWVRGFNFPPYVDPSSVQHDGWDLGAPTGEPICGGPNGGLVVQSFQCAKCTPERPSTLMNGYSLGDARIFSDEGWGFGYGNFIIVRYLHDQLPNSTRDALAERGFPGGHLFVMYAHLERRLAEAGTTLTPGQQIATCGNTGNSEAAHLHLEVRASQDPQFTRWALIRSGVLDPVVLFKR